MLTHQAWRVFGQLSAGEIARSLPRRFAYMWSTSDDVPPGRSWTRALHTLAQVQYGFLIVLALVGVALSRRRLARQWMFWLLPVYVTLLHLVFHGLNRYTVPARTTLMIYCGVALIQIFDQLAPGRLRARRRVAV